ncbi:TlpA family protein disulfide reductase [Natrinema zhouii]|uniref:TlpA family protein disulfide reductase n=1 Tax=Natrinema zhouii TaxID=1710539 RepID=A0A7D6CPD9_9EURY|nr:TlpA disulfide reductase family protein [Natrinema zhouii]QLK26752.1 TlpA family protein disulfide reductase [Natrinema zhouii]
MRRREVLAGLGSAGVVAGAGAVAAFGVPSFNDDSDGSSGLVGRQHDPYEIETADAPGSEAGTVTVPAPDRPTFIDFFATWCDPCIKQMDALATTHERVGDDVVFLSVTSEPVGESITSEELAEWWDENDGNWTIGLDPTSELTSRYWGSPYPSAVAIDASGTVRWHDSGIKTADELVAGIERALESGAE